jgi:hypothetical protein
MFMTAIQTVPNPRSWAASLKPLFGFVEADQHRRLSLLKQGISVIDGIGQRIEPGPICCHREIPRTTVARTRRIHGCLQQGFDLIVAYRGLFKGPDTPTTHDCFYCFHKIILSRSVRKILKALS